MRTVLLDLDGTLADSAALITQHLSAALAGVGVVRAPSELLPLVGPPFETALPELGLTDVQTAATITAYRKSYNAVAATATPLFPGIPALLRRLADAGMRMAVATSKPEDVAAQIVEGTGIAGAFALVGGADHLAGRVGKGAVVASVLQRLGIDPEREPVVMVGDRHHDVDGAAEHGIPTVGVAWGYAPPGELSGAAAIVATADELAELLVDGDPALWSAPVRAARASGMAHTQP